MLMDFILIMKDWGVSVSVIIIDFSFIRMLKFKKLRPDGLTRKD